jgi:uncharacterized protein (TIGR00730 family)
MRKPELIQNREGIRSTVVVFGSARIPHPDKTDSLKKEVELALEGDPDNEDLQHRKRVVERLCYKAKYYDEARKFAAIVAKACKARSCRDYVIVTGGGPGIMEAANLGAFEEGGKSIGLNITLPGEQEPNPYVTPELSFQFHYFAIRKMHFLLRARALAAFPGGFGTFDELFETLTLIQTQKMEPVPIVLFGKEFWQNAINIEYLVEEGVISPGDLDLFHYVETAEEAWKYITEREIHPENHIFRPLEKEGTS